MSEERRIEVEVQVPVTPEQAWEAIATGPGITAWFMPAEVEGRVGGSVVHHPDAYGASEGTVAAYEPPHRFAYEEEAPIAEDAARPIATEFLVEARSGGTCVVRVVMSGVGDGDAWDRALESFTAGWRQALLSLRLYLTHFPGERAASVNAGAEVSGPVDSVWQELTAALGLPAEPEAGERVEVDTPGAPSLAGTVAAAGDHMLTLILDAPGRGIGFVGAGRPSEETFVFVRAQLFGPGASGAARHGEREWRDWLGRIPAANG